MKPWTRVALSLVLACAASHPAYAFTSKVTSGPISVGASGVDETKTLTASIVQQGPGDVPALLVFEGTTNLFRDSGEALKVVINTNVAANRLIIYTNNLDAATAGSFKFCENTALGNDGGGLVGGTDCKTTVPMLWALGLTSVVLKPGETKIYTGTSSNVDYVFPAQTNQALPAETNAVFFTDRAHVRTFTTKNGVLDNVATKFCTAGTTHPVAPTNTVNDGLLPQYYGEAGKDLDICRMSDSSEIIEAEELSKNIAVVGFGFIGAKGNVPNLATAASDDIVEVTGPLYLPLGADFRQASGQPYGTNTIRLELVSQ